MPQGPFKADLDTFLRTMAKTSKWARGDIHPLSGDPSKGLTELRWTSGKVEHRIIGFQLAYTNAGLHEYLMLIGCTHKQRVYSPPDAIATANDRRKMIASGQATTSEYPLITNR